MQEKEDYGKVKENLLVYYESEFVGRIRRGWERSIYLRYAAETLNKFDNSFKHNFLCIYFITP